MKIHKHIEIVRSGTPRHSSMGLKSCLMIQKSLGALYDQVGISYVNNQRDIELLIAKRPDMVFLGVKRVPISSLLLRKQKNVWLSSELDAHGIAYTGSPMSAMQLDVDKAEAKRVVSEAGLPTAPFFTAVSGQYNRLSLPLQFPLFIKPLSAGGGAGIDGDSVVHDFKSYRSKVAAITREFSTPALVETYLQGREFSVAMLYAGPRRGLLCMPVELVSAPNDRGDRMLSRQVKSDDTEQIVPVPPGPLRITLNRLALDVFKTLGARDYGRIDFRANETGKLCFLEANLLPGVANHEFISYFTAACQINQEIDYEAMLQMIVAPALERASTSASALATA